MTDLTIVCSAPECTCVLKMASRYELHVHTLDDVSLGAVCNCHADQRTAAVQPFFCRVPQQRKAMD